MVEVVPEAVGPLSDVEARVAAQLLGATLEPEEERIRACGLARSTFQDGKRRIYARGWLLDRYVPAPTALGVAHVSFVVGRPYAEQLGPLEKGLVASPETTLLWVSDESLLAVIFHRHQGSVDELAVRIQRGEFGTEGFLLTVNPSEPSVPIYFDFEGVWDRWTGARSPTRYPRALPGGGRTVPTRASPVSPALHALLSRPFAPEADARAPHLMGPATLPRSQRRLLLSGQTEWRVLPDLARLPAYRDRRISEVLVVRGSLRGPSRPVELFRSLQRERGVSPFLLSSDGRSVLLGVVATSAATAASPAAETGREVLLQTLTEHLETIEVSRFPTARLRAPVFHRYDHVATSSGR